MSDEAEKLNVLGCAVVLNDPEETEGVPALAADPCWTERSAFLDGAS